jgi:hypothetical protein
MTPPPAVDDAVEDAELLLVVEAGSAVSVEFSAEDELVVVVAAEAVVATAAVVAGRRGVSFGSGLTLRWFFNDSKKPATSCASSVLTFRFVDGPALVAVTVIAAADLEVRVVPVPVPVLIGLENDFIMMNKLGQ